MSPRTTHAAGKTGRASAFTAAAKEFGVPESLLLAVSYNQSRWENYGNQPSVGGGYGLMHLTTEFSASDQRGDPSRPLPEKRTPSKRTLDEAATITGMKPDTVKNSERDNIRAGAALLAKNARDLNGNQTPKNLGEWYTAVASMSGATDQQSAEDFADAVYASIQQGVTATTNDGQGMRLSAQSVVPDKSSIQKLHLPAKHLPASQTECPGTLKCKFVPARYAQNNPNDPFDYGNYDQANRPQDMKVEYIIIHDTEGTYQSAIDWFQDPASYTSAHYVIRSSDGEVTQMVKTKEVAWQAGNWYMNMHSIGIEHEGWAATGATWYTEAMYRSSAKLVRYLAEKYDVPLDRQHIVGHDQFLPVSPNQLMSMHVDPGPFWDWEHYMKLLGAPVYPTAGSSSNVVTIAPHFNRNKQEVTGCWNDSCVSPSVQNANFVYLHTQPNQLSPLLTDAGLHPDSSPGTTNAPDTSARATFGQQFVVADRQGDWTAVWFSGQKGWFYNPGGPNRTALSTAAHTVKPKSGLTAVTIYGRPLPEASAYPASITPLPLAPMPYAIPAGQRYVSIKTSLPNDYYHSWTFDRSGPGDGTIVIGQEKYIPINYHHRQAFVKASDVDLE